MRILISEGYPKRRLYTLQIGKNTMKGYIQHYNIWQLIKNSFSIYFHFFFRLVGIVAIFQFLPLFLIIIATDCFSIPFITCPIEIFIYLTDLSFFDELLVQIPIYILFFIAAFFSYFAVVGEISEICLGSSASIKKALLRLDARGVSRLIGTEILLMILIMSVFILPILIASVLDIITGYKYGIFEREEFVLIIFSIMLILYYYLYIRFLFVGQVVILERKYWIQALKRSAKLVRSSFWKTVLYLLIYNIVIIFPVKMINVFFLYESIYFLPLIIKIIFLAIAVIIAPLPPIFMTLFYYSLRIEKQDLTKEDIVEIKTFEAI